MSRDVQPRRRGLPTPGVPVPADRRYRRAEAPPVRRRRHGRLWTAARWVAVLGILGAVGVFGGRRLLESDLFLVRDVVVRGNVRLATADVDSLVGGLRGQNVFLVDFEHYRQQVLASSWVDQVTLSRVLPATLVVDILERTPIVVARRNQHLYLVDRTGNIIDDYRAEHASYDLPIVDGLFGGEAEAGDVVDGDRMSVTTTLIDELAGRPDLGRRLSQIDVSNPRDVLVMIDDDAAWLHLGTAEYVDRLQRYLDVRPALVDRFGAIDYADLKFDDRIYVRGRDSRVRTTTAR